MPHKVGNGAILGITSEDGLATEKRVTLMDRSNLSVIKNTVSDEFGAYYFTGLNHETNDYMVLCVDDDGNPRKAAIIYDYVQPIPAHQGGFFWGNWFVLSMSKEPLVSFIGVPDYEDSSVFYGSGSGSGRAGSAFYGISFEQSSSVTTGAANIPMIRGLSATIVKSALNHDNALLGKSPLRLSCEWVLDTASVDKVVAILLTKTSAHFTTYAYYAASVLIQVSYNPSTKSVSLYQHEVAAAGSSNKPQDTVLLVATYVLPDNLQGSVIHIAASLVYGGAASIFINGVSVVTTTVTGNAIPPQSYQYGFLYGIMGSDIFSNTQNLTSNRADFSSNLFAFYSESMTEAEADSHYKSLFQDTLPIVSGFAKSLIEDYPLFLFRLDDPIESELAIDYLRPYAKEGKNSYLTKTPRANMVSAPELSPVLGGGGLILGGGSLVNRNLTTLPVGTHVISICFFAKPDVVTTGQQTILSSTDSTSIIYFSIGIAETGKLFVFWRANNAYEVLNFNHNLDTTSTHYYTVTVDKGKEQIKLYVDATLVETLATSPNLMEIPKARIMDTCAISIGSSLSGSDRYTGFLSELSVFSKVLPQTTIQKHYDARLTI